MQVLAAQVEYVVLQHATTQGNSMYIYNYIYILYNIYIYIYIPPNTFTPVEERVLN